MFCDFRKAFGLDPEYNKQLEESMQEAEKKALKEKWCCTCEYYIPVDPNLPGFVVAYPECEKGRNPMQSCEEYRRKGYAIRNSLWADQETKRLPREAFGNQMPSFIGFGTPEYDTKLTVKTSPRWCPRRKKKE